MLHPGEKYHIFNHKVKGIDSFSRMGVVRSQLRQYCVSRAIQKSFHWLDVMLTGYSWYDLRCAVAYDLSRKFLKVKQKNNRKRLENGSRNCCGKFDSKEHRKHATFFILHFAQISEKREIF